MKIKITTSCSGLHFSFAAGETVETSAEIAGDLIKAGYAEEIKANSKRDSKAKAEENGNADA